MDNYAMGVIYAVPAGANPTPIPLAVLREASWDLKIKKDPLYGQYKAPIDVGEGEHTYTVKAKFADIRAEVFNMVVAGLVTTTGSAQPVAAEGGTIPTTPFQLTVANGATFREDARVLDLTTGSWMTRGATATGTGVYAVNTVTGQYTFFSGDVGHNVQFVYSYTQAAIGKTLTFNNALKGPSTGFMTRMYNPYKLRGGTNVQIGVEFFNVHYDNLSLGFKPSDFSEFDLSGIAAQDTASLAVWKAYIGE